MRLNRWVCAVASGAMTVSGALVQQACGNGNYCTTTAGVTNCFLYTEPATDAGPAAMRDAPKAVDSPMAASDAPPAPFGPGTGGLCTNEAGAFPDAGCDPSDEMNNGCQGGTDAGCVFSKKCGNLATCEPFVTNPAPGMGIDSFRMRLINVTAPSTLASPAIQSAVVSNAVDLPASPDAGGAPCGENGTGLFNWIIQVDKANSKIITGGAPPSTDPFGLGYCFIRGMVAGQPVAPITVPVTFKGNTFASQPLSGTLNVPIFLPPPLPKGSSIILPISAIELNQVTISEDGNCIGSVNNAGSIPSASGICDDPVTSGPTSCSRWHSAGVLGGYITLKQADAIPIVSLPGMDSLCVLLTGQSNGAATMAQCTPAALATGGDYCAGNPVGTAGHPCKGGDSVWMSAQFAASAVNVNAGAGVALCGNGVGATDGG